ncbi:hypothetical protein V8G54_004985 [Vigna mungo]|uniref:Uncharacterized protein n=1 Tax=Vigna mungo TaxID=3915 RepID=A0AAQ3PCN8_VIGMU
MGRINDAVPFFGKGFNKIYPLIMVIYTSLIAANIFDRVIKYCGNLKIFKFNDDAEDMDGFDPSGVILLQRGHKVGELVFPLARNFSITMDVESSSKAQHESDTANILGEENEDYDRSRKFGNRKYAALRTNLNEEVSRKDLTQEGVSSSFTSDGNDSQITSSAPSSSSSSSVLASRWESMMHGFKSLRSNIDSKRFIPISNAPESILNSKPSPDSLDEIFERLKHPPPEYRDSHD